MRATTICVSLLVSGLALAADRPEIPLWANGAPGSEGKTVKEVDEPPNKDHGYLKVTSVHNPSITVFLPPRATATGAAMVIAPGGGHQFLNFDQEGTNVAAYLNSIGVAGFVLKYRLAREPGSTYKIEEHALADAQRAIRLIRSRAQEWNVNPARVGIMGFSAGGRGGCAGSDTFRRRQDRFRRPDRPLEFAAGFRCADLSGNPRRELHHSERYAGDVYALRGQRQRAFHGTGWSVSYIEGCGDQDRGACLCVRRSRVWHQPEYKEPVASGDYLAIAAGRLAGGYRNDWWHGRTACAVKRRAQLYILRFRAAHANLYCLLA
jgi:hypothetical protein